MLPDAFLVSVKRKGGLPLSVYLYDPAGEAMMDEDTLHAHSFLKYIDGIFMLIDPLSLSTFLEIQEEGADVPSDAQPSKQTPMDILAHLINALESQRELTRDKPYKKKLAVVFTKTDVPLVRKTLGIVESDDVCGNWANCGNKESTRLETWLQRNEGEMHRLITARFSNVRFFAISSLGHAPSQMKAFHPENVLKPFRWILAKRKNLVSPVFHRMQLKALEALAILVVTLPLWIAPVLYAFGVFDWGGTWIRDWDFRFISEEIKEATDVDSPRQVPYEPPSMESIVSPTDEEQAYLHCVRAGAFLLLAQYDKAETECNRALSYSGPERYDLAIFIATQYSRRGLYEKAIEYLDKSTSFDPYNPQAYRIASDLISTRMTRNKTNRKKAVKYGQKAVELTESKNAYTLEVYGVALAFDYKKKKAINTLSKAVKQSRSKRAKKRVRDKIKTVTKGKIPDRQNLKLDIHTKTPYEIEPIYLEGKVPEQEQLNDDELLSIFYYRFKKMKNADRIVEAKRNLEKVLENSQNSVMRAKAHCMIGKMLEREGDLSGAESRYQLAIREAPDCFLGYNRLAWMLVTKMDDPSTDRRANKLAQRAYDITKGQRASVLDTLAETEWEIGNHRKARKFAKKAMKISGDASYYIKRVTKFASR